ncbi:MAG: hypothetical protein P0Y60_01000 [Candidatus Microbacterium colombiense]|nr:MAG: hypothetical protein P0Y60_01000 [Microbacterium sp.]
MLPASRTPPCIPHTSLHPAHLPAPCVTPEYHALVDGLSVIVQERGQSVVQLASEVGEIETLLAAHPVVAD